MSLDLLLEWVKTLGLWGWEECILPVKRMFILWEQKVTCYGLHCVFPNSDVEVLTPSYLRV